VSPPAEGGGPSVDRPPPAYVRSADGDVITVVAAGPVPAQLGFAANAEESGSYRRRVADDRAKAQVFAALRDAGVCFARGWEWSPAEVFEWLRDHGLLSGRFQSINSWSAPGIFQVWDDC
jgi:hypothetical protein